jgi:hypothetical protein
MSRSLIGGIVAIVIAALTATAYFVTTSSLEDRLRADARRRVQRGLSLLQRDSQLEGLSVQAKAEFFAADPKVLAAIKADNGGDRSRESNRAFTRFRDEQGAPTTSSRWSTPPAISSPWTACPTRRRRRGRRPAPRPPT